VSDRELHEGAAVDVWCASLDDWSRGFAVHEVSDAGVTVRRLSDADVLPQQFPPTRVRPAVGPRNLGPWR
jgi:hypothetical protein